MAGLQPTFAVYGLFASLKAGFEHEVRQLPCVELKVSVTEVVSDPELAATVQLRLDEARTCYEHGAYTSAVIMLGSLRGVLAHAEQQVHACRSHCGTWG
ncbi:hypothetical protein ACIRPX_25590 [Streptomyces sp. NPDC101225]|uniref:hypothetical protein n=1 Tax=Streptomyces sp. NPDC101225 TaxID=3366135 RepID=UPI00381D40FC